MKKLLAAVIGVFIIFIFVLSFFPSLLETDQIEIKPASDFTAVDENGIEFSLSDFRGNVTLVHITGLETPLCIECEEEMIGQLEQLEKLSKSNNDVKIITINIRKNPYSTTGKSIAEQTYGINISWNWVEDFEPFQSAGLYQEYWTYNGAFSNPTIILIDTNQSIVGVYNIYTLGKGKIDGIQTTESLNQDIQQIKSGGWDEFKGGKYNEGITFIGIFVLGIITALSPCSIALLVAMISYVGSLQKQDKKENIKKYSIQGIWIGIVFTLGMAFVFFIFGLIISSVGIFIEISTMFYLISGIILIILGINVFKPIKEIIRYKKESKTSLQVMDKGKNIFLNLSKKSIYLGAFFLGILFSIGWAPCAMSLMMPVFILTLSQKISIIMGGLLLFVFGLGHGVPIIPLCAVTSSIRGKLGNKYVAAGKWMQKLFGMIIIIIGIIMAFRFWGINLW
jgi:cytochrome c-type biogenesis protein